MIDVGLSYIERAQIAARQWGFDPRLQPADIIDFVAARVRQRRAEPAPPDGDALARARLEPLDAHVSIFLPRPDMQRLIPSS
jgi:hypothetical protein